MGYSFQLAARVLLYADRITHTMTFVTPVVEQWLEREIAQWVHHEGLIRQPITGTPIPRDPVMDECRNSAMHQVMTANCILAIISG